MAGNIVADTPKAVSPATAGKLSGQPPLEEMPDVQVSA